MFIRSATIRTENQQGSNGKDNSSKKKKQGKKGKRKGKVLIKNYVTKSKSELGSQFGKMHSNMHSNMQSNIHGYRNRERPCCKGRKSYLESIPPGTLNISRRGSVQLSNNSLLGLSVDRRISFNNPMAADRRLSAKIPNLNFAVVSTAQSNA